jgi:hypothetical protein
MDAIPEEQLGGLVRKARRPREEGEPLGEYLNLLLAEEAVLQL